MDELHKVSIHHYNQKDSNARNSNSVMNFAGTSFSLPPISDRVLVIETVNDIVDVNILEGAVTNVG